MTRLWDKGGTLDARVLSFTAGEDHALDERLVKYDVASSIAHAEMLGERGLIGADDVLALRRALESIAQEHAGGKWQIALEQEDGQTAIENLLVERLGATGGRLHAGRSRNDQVLAALRLYLCDVAAQIDTGARAAAAALDDLAARDGDIELPGYTHMQQAMPSTVALWAAGFASELRDDAEGILLTRRRSSKNPLGSAAGYGTPHLDVSREATRSRLGFAETHEPVTAVQLSRGKAEAQLLFEITLLTQDLSRLAAELVLFNTHEFGFVTLPENFTTGSSIMPQKRNPDVFELIRGRSAVAQAALNEVLAITQKLPAGYHRDLQLIKPPLFRAIDSCLQTLDLMPSALAGITFNRHNIHLDPGVYAAGEANRLVRDEQLPFREAYRRVAARLKSTR